MKTTTATQQHQPYSVADMIAILKQADQSSVVTDQLGRKVSAYLNPINLPIVIVTEDT